jgi:hypothetical protein
MIEFTAMVENVGLGAAQVSSFELGHCMSSTQQIATCLTDLLDKVQVSGRRIDPSPGWI